ncbi:MAG TPA: hypothetical protein VGV08_00820 [Casimicrobiaceae bacterium]|nr:hypothetical protein [Casimicrobiaceae bacterium]
MHSPNPRIAGPCSPNRQRIPFKMLRGFGAPVMAAIMAIIASAPAYTAIAPSERPLPSIRHCSSARKALGKEERALAGTKSRIVRATKLLASCGSRPMCDGYHQELSMLDARKSKLETRIDLRKSAVERSCAEPAASASK